MVTEKRFKKSPATLAFLISTHTAFMLNSCSKPEGIPENSGLETASQDAKISTAVKPAEKFAIKPGSFQTPPTKNSSDNRNGQSAVDCFQAFHGKSVQAINERPVDMSNPSKALASYTTLRHPSTNSAVALAD